jgi:D-alanine-D-alanine ligase
MKKIRVGILFGGRSGEHEVSLLSAASVFNAIDKNKYEVVPIGITKEGRWVTAADAERLLQGKFEEGKHLRAGDPEATPGAAVLAKGEAVVVPPEPQRHGAMSPFETDASSHALTRRAADRAIDVDVIFPCCTALSARMEPSKACWNWPTWLTWARACSAQPRAWTRTS